ncbi:MAG: tRNA preQ1(34) S-adenosylmethionine ribosyltransferase-isomerase QueA [Candidatus Omnitrophota bacterium]
MRLSEFDYYLPRELIAQYPLKERGNSRLLVLKRANRTIEHRAFKDIILYLKPQDLLVVNNTKVLPCRLQGRRQTGGKVEVLLLNRKKGLTFKAMLKPARLKSGEQIIFNDRKKFGIISGKDEITFSGLKIKDIYGMGVMPLPPYIKREPKKSDNITYQTVYAKKEGAIASPTAGLHFTRQLIKKIESQGTKIAYVTLHVGPGTFKPVKTEDIREHKMEPEHFLIPQSSARLINQATADGGRVFAVGTTSLRAIETYANGTREGSTGLFIYPGYKFKITDCLLTNFHLPRTTLYMLVCAFAGSELILRAYKEAIENKYRFYSYGDAMLII